MQLEDVTRRDESTGCALYVTSVTQLDTRHRGKVVAAGSHGGLIAAYLATLAGVRAVILNDAGVGKDKAGIAGLNYLASLGMAAACVAHTTARIGDGADMLARGRISHANVHAQRCGVEAGMATALAARLLETASTPIAAPPEQLESAHLLLERAGRQVWGLDTMSLACASHAGSVLVSGSHGGLLAGQSPAQVTPRCSAAAAVFSDAGGGIDDAGFARLWALDDRGMPAVTVSTASARIGDAVSIWETGILSRANAAAKAVGAAAGMNVREFASLVLRD